MLEKGRRYDIKSMSGKTIKFSHQNTLFIRDERLKNEQGIREDWYVFFNYAVVKEFGEYSDFITRVKVLSNKVNIQNYAVHTKNLELTSMCHKRYGRLPIAQSFLEETQRIINHPSFKDPAKDYLQKLLTHYLTYENFE